MVQIVPCKQKMYIEFIFLNAYKYLYDVERSIEKSKHTKWIPNPAHF
jgi:hypothetical protein